MKTIGLIGGMSWESTLTYYRLINESVKVRLGGLHSARIILHSVDFHEIAQLQKAGDWHAAGAQLIAAARSLQAAGADVLLLCTNTMHKVADAIQAAVNVPFLHIADATAQEIRDAGITTVGLLGTRFTMEEDFYRDRLGAAQALQVLIPGEADRETVHRVIYDELCLGQVSPASRVVFRKIMADLSARGAQGVILGCTEIALLVDQTDAAVPLFDTTRIHALKAVDWALGVE